MFDLVEDRHIVGPARFGCKLEFLYILFWEVLVTWPTSIVTAFYQLTGSFLFFLYAKISRAFGTPSTVTRNDPDFQLCCLKDDFWIMTDQESDTPSVPFPFPAWNGAPGAWISHNHRIFKVWRCVSAHERSALPLQLHTTQDGTVGRLAFLVRRPLQHNLNSLCCKTKLTMLFYIYVFVYTCNVFSCMYVWVWDLWFYPWYAWSMA